MTNERIDVGRFLRCALKRAWLPVVGLLLIAIWLAFPVGGEWIAGGWDPGVYMNSGVSIARRGWSATWSAGLDGEVHAANPRAFTRSIGGMVEAFPGFPVDPATGRFQCAVPPLTPLWIGFWGRVSGIDGALKTPLLTGMLAVAVFGAFCFRVLPRGGRVPALVLLSAQPLLLYHLRAPSSEILELLILVGLLALADRLRDGRVAVACGLLMACGALNRTSFPLFGSLLVLMSALAEMPNADRKGVLRAHLIVLAGLVVGYSLTRWVTPLAFARIGHVMGRLGRVSIGLGVLALAVDGIALHERWRAKAFRWARFLWPWVLGGAIVFPLMGWALLAMPGISGLRSAMIRANPAFAWFGFSELRANGLRIAEYVGAPVAVLSVLGAAVFCARRGRGMAAGWGRASVAFLLLSTLIVLKHKHVAELYPWATKRFLCGAAPLAAVLSGYFLSGAWAGAWLSPSARRLLAWTGLGACLVLMWPQMRVAWAATEYDGLRDRLEAVVEQGGDGDDIWVVDHFRWATPLRFVYGRAALNGERLWNTADATEGVGALSAAREKGLRVWVLTSTDEGADIFPPPLNEARLVWEAPPVGLRSVAHHRNSKGFWMRQETVPFRLYEWMGAR